MISSIEPKGVAGAYRVGPAASQSERPVRTPRIGAAAGVWRAVIATIKVLGLKARDFATIAAPPSRVCGCCRRAGLLAAPRRTGAGLPAERRR